MIEYMGEVVDEAEQNRRLCEYRRLGIDDMYVMELANGTAIDAKNKVSVGRWGPDLDARSQRLFFLPTGKPCSLYQPQL